MHGFSRKILPYPILPYPTLPYALAHLALHLTCRILTPTACFQQCLTSHPSDGGCLLHQAWLSVAPNTVGGGCLLHQIPDVVVCCTKRGCLLPLMVVVVCCAGQPGAWPDDGGGVRGVRGLGTAAQGHHRCATHLSGSTLSLTRMLCCGLA